tara:strand:+ start:48064 stop:49467 length:1404 start_codon:yes stop_codon:yes gene_type:complete
MKSPASIVLLLIWMSAGVLAERPNVIILFTDDHGTLDANCLGASDLLTPNIDRLADSGIRFTQAYAHQVCCPSRAALLTGRHPQRTGVDDWAQGNRRASEAVVANSKAANANLKTEEITIAEALKSAGYETALFGKWHLGARVGHGPLDQGFDQFFGHLGGFIDNYRHYFLHGKGFHDLYDNNEEIFRPGEYFPDMMMERAIEFLEADHHQPFFLMVAFNLPHYPEQPTGKFADAYADMAMPRQSYARVVSTVDDYIGRVLDKLDEKAIRKNTIIVLMGDNGHSAEDNKGVLFDDHKSGFPLGHYYSANGGGGFTGKWIGHKGQYLEGGIRVPAILSHPASIPGGQVRDQVVTVMDWFPTILEIATIPKPNVKFDGHSLLPIIHDADAKSSHQELHFGWPSGWAVRKDEWKLIAKLNRNKPEMIHLSLHNLADQRPELADYAKRRPDIVRRLTKLHNTWAADVSGAP